MFILITTAISSLHQRLRFARWMLNFYLKNMRMQISTNRFNYPAADILYSQAKMLSKMQVARFGSGTAYENSSPIYRRLPGFCTPPCAVSRHAGTCFRREDIQDIKLNPREGKHLVDLFALHEAECLTSAGAGEHWASENFHQCQQRNHQSCP